eukprot:6202561-Pleurochrysis_carterae.AAC.1
MLKLKRGWGKVRLRDGGGEKECWRLGERHAQSAPGARALPARVLAQAHVPALAALEPAPAPGRSSASPASPSVGPARLLAVWRRLRVHRRASLNTKVTR